MRQEGPPVGTPFSKSLPHVQCKVQARKIHSFPRQPKHCLLALLLPKGAPGCCPAVEGPLPDVDLVIDVLVKADLTPDGITAHELAAARERRRQRRIAEQQQGGGLIRPESRYVGPLPA